MDCKNIIDSLDYTIKSCNDLLSKENLVQNNISSLNFDLKEKQDYLTFIKGAKEKYQVAVTELYEESIKALSDTLNTALQYIFYDKNYKAKLVLDDKRGTKTLSTLLVDEDNNLEIDMRDIGQGVRTVISFILKSYYLLNQNSKVLFLDEKYSALSSHYVPRFYDFMKKFCEENDFIIVMISHIDNQIEHADKIYYLNDGVISEDNILAKTTENNEK